MKIHIHDNNDVPKKHNCLSETELPPGEVLTLHVHPGDCQLCASGHCHDGSINLLMVDDALYVVFEGVRCPGLITQATVEPHHPPTH